MGNAMPTADDLRQQIAELTEALTDMENEALKNAMSRAKILTDPTAMQ